MSCVPTMYRVPRRKPRYTTHGIKLVLKNLDHDI